MVTESNICIICITSWLFTFIKAALSDGPDNLRRLTSLLIKRDTFDSGRCKTCKTAVAYGLFYLWWEWHPVAHKLSAVQQQHWQTKKKKKKKHSARWGAALRTGRPVVSEDGDGWGVAGAVGQVQAPDLTHHVQIAGRHSLLALRDPTKVNNGWKRG